MKKSNGRSAVAGGVMAAMLVVGMAAVSTVASAAEPRLVKLKGSDAMQYDVKVIQATPGEALKVTLTAVSSMAKAEIPRRPCPGSVTAKTTVRSATEPCVVKVFDPFRIHPPPGAGFAVDFVPPASLPAVGSVRLHAPIHSPLASFGT